MSVIDASSVVHAWDNYPIDNFPRFWDWIDNKLSRGDILIPGVALEEVGHVSPDCWNWLKEQGVGKVDVTASIARHAQQIKLVLGISNDEYSSGVDENDIIVIATAKSLGKLLVSNEAKQPALPANMKKYKIPAVCSVPVVGIDCVNIAEYIKSSKAIFYGEFKATVIRDRPRFSGEPATYSANAAR